MTAPRPGTYSAWNWRTGQFDYFVKRSGMAGYGDPVGHPKARVVDNPVGESPEQSAQMLPRGARKVGSGEVALGEVVAVQETTSDLAAWGRVALALVIPSLLLWATVSLTPRAKE